MPDALSSSRGARTTSDPQRAEDTPLITLHPLESGYAAVFSGETSVTLAQESDYEGETAMNQTPARVLVAYPRGVQTGGPEALHQLVDSLRRLGVSAWLWPTPNTRDRERVADYERYDAPETTEMMDTLDTAVVLPETGLNLSTLWKSATLYSWWLSVDNAPYFRNRRRMQNAVVDGARPSLGLLRSVVGSQRWVFRDRGELRRMTHLTQSQYAWGFIRRNLWVESTMLGDYIPDAVPRDVDKPETFSVAFNPSKGRALTEQIQSIADSSITWMPIQGLSREGVSSLLHSATVYLETGHQPGKDRLPREAALHGCVVVALRRGAGANDRDCPLPSEHKVKPGAKAAHRFVTILDGVMTDVHRHRALQRPYLDMVLADKEAFDRAVKGIFYEGQRGISDWYGRSEVPRRGRSGGV